MPSLSGRQGLTLSVRQGEDNERHLGILPSVAGADVLVDVVADVDGVGCDSLGDADVHAVLVAVVDVFIVNTVVTYEEVILNDADSEVVGLFTVLLLLLLLLMLLLLLLIFLILMLIFDAEVDLVRCY